MYSYALLEPGCYYLIQEKEESPVSLIQITVESDHCMFVSNFGDDESMVWKRKTDPIFDIVELLNDSTAKEWETLYNNNKDAYNYEEDDD